MSDLQKFQVVSRWIDSCKTAEQVETCWLFAAKLFTIAKGSLSLSIMIIRVEQQAILKRHLILFHK